MNLKAARDLLLFFMDSRCYCGKYSGLSSKFIKGYKIQSLGLTKKKGVSEINKTLMNKR